MAAVAALTALTALTAMAQPAEIPLRTHSLRPPFLGA